MKKIFIFIFLILLFILLKQSHFSTYLTLNYIQSQKDNLNLFCQQHHLQFILYFILVYIIVVTFQMPGSLWLSLLAGAMFGPFWGTLWINLGSSTGSLLAFLWVRYLFHDQIKKKFTKQLKKFNQEMRGNGFKYILFLRMVPVIPFILINILAGLTEIKTKDFYQATVLGIIPASFAFCNLGSAIWSINSAQDLFSRQSIFAISIFVFLLFLPIFHKKFR